jgi:hypothetical protein
VTGRRRGRRRRARGPRLRGRACAVPSRLDSGRRLDGRASSRSVPPYRRRGRRRRPHPTRHPIARGLDYYTGIVFETRLDDQPEIGSVCSGGRYDDPRSCTRRSCPASAPRSASTGCGDRCEPELDRAVFLPFFDASSLDKYLRLAADLRAADRVELYRCEEARCSSSTPIAEVQAALVLGEDGGRADLPAQDLASATTLPSRRSDRTASLPEPRRADDRSSRPPFRVPRGLRTPEPGPRSSSDRRRHAVRRRARLLRNSASAKAAKPRRTRRAAADAIRFDAPTGRAVDDPERSPCSPASGPGSVGQNRLLQPCPRTGSSSSRSSASAAGGRPA